MPLDPSTAETQEDGAAEATPTGGNDYAKAFRVLRHALADGDDEAGGMALRDAVKLCTAGGYDEPDGDEGPPEKPNLAAILIGKRKKD